MISKADQESLKLARKYGIRPGTTKHHIFTLFEEGCTTIEVVYLCRDFYTDRKEKRTFSNTVRRYYALWKKAQPPVKDTAS